MAIAEVYSAETTINNFFLKASATRGECEARAAELTGGKAVPVTIQGDSSYTVYAGPELEHVVQFRLKSLELKTTTSDLASKIYGTLAPTVAFKGQIGDEVPGKEPLYIYAMDRIKGVSHLDFILASKNHENPLAAFAARKNLMTGVAKFHALSWNTPQVVDPEYQDELKDRYSSQLALLHKTLPERFHPSIQSCRDAMESIMSLPMVLLHKDFGTFHIMVNEESCHFVGAVGWAEAQICPFGSNLHSLQQITGKLHYEDGWSRYDDYDDLQETFWSVFQREVGGLPEETLQTIKLARIMGLLLAEGFTGHLKDGTGPVPIQDDEVGRYMMLSLDGFLLNEATKFN
uniref:Aminoglycoside phosphotransferase domain-containing protein n=1 Tax=Bionectria ochroleuca TaxID=29856 RepID=A0A8H7K6U9_BIOOC